MRKRDSSDLAVVARAGHIVTFTAGSRLRHCVEGMGLGGKAVLLGIVCLGSLVLLINVIRRWY